MSPHISSRPWKWVGRIVIWGLRCGMRPLKCRQSHEKRSLPIATLVCNLHRPLHSHSGCSNIYIVGKDLRAILVFELKWKYWPIKYSHFGHSSEVEGKKSDNFDSKIFRKAIEKEACFSLGSSLLRNNTAWSFLSTQNDVFMHDDLSRKLHGWYWSDSRFKKWIMDMRQLISVVLASGVRWLESPEMVEHWSCD